MAGCAAAQRGGGWRGAGRLFARAALAGLLPAGRRALTRPAPQVGVASTGERLRNSLAAAREGAPTVRAFLTASAELRAAAGVPDSKGVDAALMAAVDKAEAAAGGAPLLFSDAKGLAALKAAAAAIADKAGLKGASVAALEAAAAKEEAANLVGSVKAARDGAVEMTKARDGLAYL